MKWRDRLALWCLRRLTPGGLGEHGAKIAQRFDSGLSTPEDPRLVMRFVAGEQILLSVVIEDPGEYLTYFAGIVDRLEKWARENRTVSS